MTSSSEQPPYEMQDAYILTKEDWLRLREHLTIGCTNQKVFLDTLHPHPAPLAKENLTVGMVTAYEAGLADGARPSPAPAPEFIPAKECMGRYDECAEEKCECMPHCIMASNNLRIQTRKAREDVLKELKDWACKNRTQVTEWNDGLPFVWWYLLRDEIDFLRSTTPQTEQEQPKEYIITEEQIGEAMENTIDLRKMHDLVEKILLRPHPTPAPMSNDYRELFVRDLLYNFRWTAEHGNPEFFKAVEMIKREYLKPESRLLAEHDAATLRKAREDVLKELKDWACKNRTQVTEWNDGLPFVWWYLLRDEIDFLRSTTPQSEQEGRER